MSEHYVKGAHISQISSALLDSGTCKWICSLKHQLLPHMGLQGKLGNGPVLAQENSVFNLLWILLGVEMANFT